MPLYSCSSVEATSDRPALHPYASDYGTHRHGRHPLPTTLRLRFSVQSCWGATTHAVVRLEAPFPWVLLAVAIAGGAIDEVRLIADRLDDATD
jgi:hypothetical protein